MVMTLSEMLNEASKSSKKSLPTHRRRRRKTRNGKLGVAKPAPKRKRRKRSMKAKQEAKIQKVMEAPHRLDLDGNPIIPYAQKPKNALCLRCRGECKQTTGVVVCFCPHYNPVKPRKNAKEVA